MTDWEIRQMYRLSKDKLIQLEILSHLSCKNIADIVEIVEDIPIDDDGQIRYINGVEYKHYQDYMDVCYKEYKKKRPMIVKRIVQKKPALTATTVKKRAILSKKLKRLIFNDGLDVLHFSYIINEKKSTVYAWCNGDRLPREESLERLARYFEVEKEWFFTEET